MSRSPQSSPGSLSRALAAAVLALALAPASAAGSSTVTSITTTTTTSHTCAAARVTTVAETTVTETATSTTATIGGGTSPEDAPGGSCWEEVNPYPFGGNGKPVEGDEACETCRLTVTSMSFRAWNRGVAATIGVDPQEPSKATRYAVWTYNGSTWLPNTAFLAPRIRGDCTGNTVIWAGKDDYWLVGGAPAPLASGGRWADLCRYNGEPEAREWQPLRVPETTEQRLTYLNGENELRWKYGTISSGACSAWNNCWFFGTYGIVLHWNGGELSDASPEPFASLLQGEYLGAVSRQSSGGEWFGVAVGGSAASESEAEPLSKSEAEGVPVQMYAGSGGGGFSPVALDLGAPRTLPQPEDPSRTDLVAVDLDAAGEGWVAGDPSGFRLPQRTGGDAPTEEPQQTETSRPEETRSEQPAPLIPVTRSGEAPSCPGPSEEPARFTYAPEPIAGDTANVHYLWSTIAALPSEPADALAGGEMWPGPEYQDGEPVIVRANCDGTTTATSLSDGQDPSAPADVDGGVTAIAASDAVNEAWAATGAGKVDGGPPRLYRLTDGGPPVTEGGSPAPEANDEEPRPKPQKPEQKYIEEVVPAEAVLVPEAVTKPRKVKLPAALYDVSAKVHTALSHGRVQLSLYISFKLRRSVTVGAEALRKKRVVSIARPRRFVRTAHRLTGLLILDLSRTQWPTSVKFLS